MEVESSPIHSAKPPPLNSDQLNYLIWRYLQEAGYAEAAVKLQRDWKVDVESLPFARHVKGQALVSLVQKGLRYHHLSLTIDENGRPSKQINPAMFFFGPESEKPVPEAREPIMQPALSNRAVSPSTSSTTTRKHGREIGSVGTFDTTSQSGAKKSRKAGSVAATERNGSTARKPSAAAVGSTNLLSAMDVDNVNGNASSINDAISPSATEPGAEENGLMTNGLRPDERMDVDTDVEQQDQEPGVEVVPPLVHTLTNGESVGIQVAPAKVANLSPTSTILNVPQNGHVTRTIWRPDDSSVLTTVGDSFCGLWKLNNGPEQLDLAQSPFRQLVESNAETLVSAIAWEPNGMVLAVATYTNQSGQLHLFDGQDLGLVETLPASQRAITALQWQKHGLRLIGIAPYDDQNPGSLSASSILLWDLSGDQSMAGPLSITVPETLLDIDCASYNNSGITCAAGDKAVYYCRAFTELEVEQKWTSPPADGDQWTFVRCVWRGANDAMLVAASADTARIWLPAKNAKKSEAHNAAITALQIRPRLALNTSSMPTIEFATSSMDGNIKVWQLDEGSNNINCISKLIIGHASPIMTLSYSPDGFCLAGASYANARIWNAEHGYHHMASWEDKNGDWKGSSLKDDDMMSTGGLSSINGDAIQSSTDHSLAWNMDSEKLAFGLGSQVALINFQR